MKIYRNHIDSRSGSANESAAAQVHNLIERDFKIVAIQADRSTIVDLARDRRIGSATIRKLVRELDLVEARYRS